MFDVSRDQFRSTIYFTAIGIMWDAAEEIMLMKQIKSMLQSLHLLFDYKNSLNSRNTI